MEVARKAFYAWTKEKLAVASSGGIR